MALLGLHSFAEFTTFVTFVLLGMSIMMVISAVTSAPDFVSQYYKFAMGDANAVPENDVFWTNVNTFYNVGTYVAQLTFEPMALIPAVRRVSLRGRLCLGFCISMTLMAIFIAVPYITISSQNGAILVVMICSALCGTAKALCDSCTNALVAPFPTKFLIAVMLGLGLCPLFMSVLQVLLMSSMGDSFESQLTQSRIYLSIGMGIEFLSLTMFLVLHLNPFAREYIADFRVIHNGDKNTGGTVSFLSCNKSAADNLLESLAIPRTAAVLYLAGDADHLKDEDQFDRITSGEQMARAGLRPVVVKTYPMQLCLVFVFFLTMLLFPGVFFAVDDEDAWYMTLVVLLFNIGDVSGRIVLMIRMFRPTPTVIVFGCIGRCLVVPFLLIGVNLVTAGKGLSYLLAYVHGATNGYFGTMAMVHATRTCAFSCAGERSLAAMVCGAAVMLGLCLGSNGALLVNLFAPT